MIQLGGKTYELIKDNRDGFNFEAFRERYSDVLGKFDYIVGDWGYNQLRLKGFFKDTNTRAAKESRFSFLEDYIYEYCNFGCAYFIVQKMPNSNRAKTEEQGGPKQPEQAK